MTFKQAEIAKELHMDTNELIGEIYEAALDETRWHSAIKNLCEIVGADWAAIVFHDRLNRQRNRFWSYGVNAGASQVYVEQFIDIDMDDARQHLLAAPESEVFSFYWDKVEFAKNVSESEMIDNSASKDLATLIDGYGKSVSRMAAKLLETPNMFAVVQVSRSGMHSLKKFDDEEFSLMKIVAPHFARACRIYHQLSAVRNQNEKLLQTLKFISHGVLLLSGDFRVMYSNEEGGRILQKHPALSVGRYGRLKAARNSEDYELQRMLEELLGQRYFVSSSEAPTLGLTCDTCVHPLKLSAVPLLASGLDPQLESEGVCIAVFVTDVDRNVIVPEFYLKKTYGLTIAECEVASALTNGATTTDIARQRAVAESTVRWQIKCLLRKTSTSTQSELVRLLVSVSLDSSLPI